MLRRLTIALLLAAGIVTLLPADAPAGPVAPVSAHCVYWDPIPVCKPCTPPLDPEDPPRPEDVIVVCPL